MDFDDDFVNLARCDPPNFLCFSLSVYVSVGLSRFLCLSLSLALSLALTSAPVIFAVICVVKTLHMYLTKIKPSRPEFGLARLICSQFARQRTAE